MELRVWVLPAHDFEAPTSNLLARTMEAVEGGHGGRPHHSCCRSSGLGSLAQDSRIWRVQDFEALTPNLLAHAMETVEGGGLIAAAEAQGLGFLAQGFRIWRVQDFEAVTLDLLAHAMETVEGGGLMVLRVWGLAGAGL